MGGERPDRRVGFNGHRQHLPRPAPILRALDRSRAPGCAISRRDEDHLRVVRAEREAPAIREVKVLGHSEALPALARVGAREDLAGRARQHRLGLADADGDVVNVGVFQPARDAAPGLAAIETAADAVDLDARPDDTMVRRVDGERRDPRDSYVLALFGHVDRELLPALSGVARAEERRRPRAGEDRVGIHGVDGDLPDMHRVHRRIETLETHASILTAVDPVVRAGIEDLCLRRMDGEAEHTALVPQPLPDSMPRFSAVCAVPRPCPNGSDTDAEVLRHDSLLLRGRPLLRFAPRVVCPTVRRQDACPPRACPPRAYAMTGSARSSGFVDRYFVWCGVSGRAAGVSVAVAGR